MGDALAFEQQWRPVRASWPELHYCPHCRKAKLLDATHQGRVLVALLLFKCSCGHYRVVNMSRET